MQNVPIRRQMRRRAAVMAAVSALGAAQYASATTSTYQVLVNGSSSWATATNWDTNPTVPNAVGDTAIFPTATSTTGTRTVSLNSSPGFTVGTLSVDVSTQTSTTIATGSPAGALTLNNGGSGVSLTVSGSGAATATGQLTISAPVVFSDNVTAHVDQTTASSAAGALNLTTAISGTGGFTKTGDGLATFGTGAKTYSGATVISAGRIRISSAAQPSNTSSFTIAAGGQVDPLSSSYTLGPGTLNLNGSGPTSGPFAVFPGAIRPDTNINANFSNNVNVQSDSLLAIHGAGLTSITFSGKVSGVGALILNDPSENQDNGTLRLNNATNDYSGGTVLNAGTIDATTGSLGTGPLTVNGNIQSGFVATSLVKLNTSAPTTTGPLSGGLLHSVSAASTLTIDNGGQLFTVNQNALGTYVGSITGSGGFALSALSNNTLNLTTTSSGATLSYTGDTTVNAGTLALSTNLVNSSNIVVNGGVIQMTTGGSHDRLINTSTVSTPGGVVDVTDNKMIVTGSDYTTIKNQVLSGRNTGNWDGAHGIITSQNDAKLATNATTLAVATASDVAGPSSTFFDGVNVNPTDVLVMYTYNGDANMDGRVNADDYFIIDSNLNKPSANVFAKGDFNYDGVVNGDDYAKIDSGFALQGGSLLSPPLGGVSAVPEPASLALLGLTGLGLVRRRRRGS